MARAQSHESSGGLSLKPAGRLVDSAFDEPDDHEYSRKTQRVSSRFVWPKLLQSRNDSPRNRFRNQKDSHVAMYGDRRWLSDSHRVLNENWRSTQKGKSTPMRVKGLYLIKTINRPKTYVPRKIYVTTQTHKRPTWSWGQMDRPRWDRGQVKRSWWDGEHVKRPWWDGGQITTYSTYVDDWNKYGRPRYFRRKESPWSSGKVRSRGPVFDPYCAH
jgi:hypothetical protein